MPGGTTRAERLARALEDDLRAAGLDAQATGRGDNWHLDVRSEGTRELVVNCFWYPRRMPGPPGGVSPGNGRSALHAPGAYHEGPAYRLVLRDLGARVADGRTASRADVVTGVTGWIRGRTLEALVAEVPFLDRLNRAMHARAAKLDPRLRWTIGEEPLYELWVYGEGRSCRILEADGEVSCRFFLQQASVALALGLTDLPAAVAAWLLEGVGLRALAAHAPEVALEPHAEVLEDDPARWHWLHVLDCVAHRRDGLAPMLPLIEALAASPVASRFYTYSSHRELHFSASSHFPWVDAGLPRVVRSPTDGYLVDGDPCDEATALRAIEAKLAASPVRPFFGSAPHHELGLIAAWLARQGSTLAPRLEQHGSSYQVVLEHGARQCQLSSHVVRCSEGARWLQGGWPGVEDMARVAHWWLEGGASFDEVEADPAARLVRRGGRSPEA